LDDNKPMRRADSSRANWTSTCAWLIDRWYRHSGRDTGWQGRSFYQYTYNINMHQHAAQPKLKPKLENQIWQQWKWLQV